MFTGSSLSEQQAAVQEHIQSLNETEYSFVMNKFNVSCLLSLFSVVMASMCLTQATNSKQNLLLIEKQKNMLNVKERERRRKTER